MEIAGIDGPAAGTVSGGVEIDFLARSGLAKTALISGSGDMPGARAENGYCKGDIASDPCDTYTRMGNELEIGTGCHANGCCSMELPCEGFDVDLDGDADNLDLIEFLSHVDDCGCNISPWAGGAGAGSDWCENADLGRNGCVDIDDYIDGTLYVDSSTAVSGFCNLPENIEIKCHSPDICPFHYSQSECEGAAGCTWVPA